MPSLDDVAGVDGRYGEGPADKAWEDLDDAGDSFGEETGDDGFGKVVGKGTIHRQGW